MISKLIHELLMKPGYPSYPIRSRGQERRSDMQRAWFLTEAGAGDHTDTGGVQKTTCVELVGRSVLFLRLLDGCFGDVDSGEEIHGTLFPPI